MIRRVFFIIILFILFITSFVFYVNKAFLYSPIPTHYNLTQQMIDLYNLTYDPDITMKQIELIMKGSIDEDTLPRPAFHLYDPVYNRAPFGVYTAKKWALDSNAQTPFYLRIAALKKIFTGTFLYHGDYSWPASVDYFVKDDLNEAYYGLGHILHLIEDMTVPAHSRNDHHLMGDPFEQWARDSTVPDDYNWAEKLYNQGYYPKYLYSLEQTFDDLARYSNKYFFSKDTILSSDYNWPKIIKEQSEDYGHFMQRTYLWGRDEEGKLFRLAYKDYSKVNWYNAFYLDQKQDVYIVTKYDHKLNSDYWQRLAPKAIIYGAGVIRLFMKDVKLEKEKLTQKEPELNWFQKAQTFVKGLLGIGEEDKGEEMAEYIPLKELPQPKPTRFPVAEDVEEVVEETLIEEQVIETPTETPSDEEMGEVAPPEPPQPSDEGEGQEAPEQEQYQPEPQVKGASVVKGPKTGGDGGISWRQAEEIAQQRAGGEVPEGEEQQEEEKQEEEEEEEEEKASHLVINEVQVKDNEFVELFNPLDTAISLASYSFCYYSKSRDWNDPWRKKEFPATASISAEGYYLIGLKGYPASSGNPDSDWQVYESNQLSNSAGSVAIFPWPPWDPLEKTASQSQPGAIDTVAWGDVENVMEGTPFQETISIDKSIQRKGNGQDTDDNNTDFELNKIPSPTNSNGEERIPGTTIADTTVISEDTTWTIANSPYYIESNANQWPIVNSGVTLFIEPGVVIMPLNAHYTFLEIRGTLEAKGTKTEKIVFTSKNDTEYGGTGSASAGDWKNMIFTDTSTDSVFEYVLFLYGGHSNKEMIRVDGSSIEIKNSTIENSQTNGVYLKNSNSEIKDSIISDTQIGIVIEGGAPEIENCQIKDNSYYGIEIKNGAEPEIKDNSFSNNLITAVYLQSAYPEFSNNSVSNNGLNGILVDSRTVISQDETWEADLVYILESNKNQFTTVASGSTLTLEPDVVLKPMSKHYTALLVEGTLIAEATSGSEIVITSLKDDDWGGDTNNDGDATAPSDGDWTKIEFAASSQGSVLDHVFIYYGTGTPPFTIDPGVSVEERDVDYEP